MNVGIIGAPVDLGADRRGVDMGASAIRYAGLEARLRSNGHNVRDHGNITVQPPESTDTGTPDLKYLRQIIHMSEELASCVAQISDAGSVPVILGGDHSVSLGSISGLSRRRKLSVFWLDAHGDFNSSSTSPSGNIHGMVLAALCGKGDTRLVNTDHSGAKIEPGNVALIGVRELDPGERALLQESGVRVFTMHEIDRMGLPGVIESAIDGVTQDTDGIYISLDLDVVDPLQAPGVGTPVFGGLNYRETHLAMELLAETNKVVGLDVVEVNPVLDNHNETAKLAMEFILSGLGKRIL